jgi:cytochrome c oxidase accessory protein FixG
MNAANQTQEVEPPLLKPEGRVLSTMEEDGSRRWLKPKLSRGKFFQRRRIMAYLLILIFTLLPLIKVNGTPLILLDIVNREFTVGFVQFLPTDTVLLALFMVSVFLAIVFFTAVLGRVWCGWACPQTVYMEFVFRPIERLLDGTLGRGGTPKKKIQGWRLFVKYAIYFGVCFYLAHTFLAYFVGVDRLSEWIWRSAPWEHPLGFGVVALVTLAMMFDFCFFREQLCIIACPYGRFQSVLLDRSSWIVAYDKKRGEPRGKSKSASNQGDCVDCKLCVTTCPTGIDIRDGLQLECINCTQCIDACNTVMHKIGRAPNLIRYSSQARDAGETRTKLRPRVILYPMILAVVVSTLIYNLATQASFEAVALRGRGNPYQVSEGGIVSNTFELHLTNRLQEKQTIEIVHVEPEFVQCKFGSPRLELQPGTDSREALVVTAENSRLNGKPVRVQVTLRGADGKTTLVRCTLQGPP